MAFIRNIANHDLMVNGKAVSFAVKTMREILESDDNRVEDPHRHNFFTVLWAMDVEGEHTIDLHTFPIEKDTLFFIHPEQVHQLQAAQEPEGIVILFTEDFLVRNGFHERFINRLELFSENGTVDFLKITENREELSMLASRMQDVYRESGQYREDKFGAYLKLFLILCSEQKMKSETVPSAEMPPEIVRKFKQLVEQNYLEWHKVSDYAEKLLISSNYLNEVIKKNTGRTAKEHIRNRLVAEARRLAHFTSLSSKEIGFRLGFNDPSHFAKFLKKFVSKSNT